MKLGELQRRRRFAGVEGAKEVLGLMPELVEVGPDGQVTTGHDEPPRIARGPLASGAKEVRVKPLRRAKASGGLGPSRGREASWCALAVILLLVARAVKEGAMP